MEAAIASGIGLHSVLNPPQPSRLQNPSSRVRFGIGKHNYALRKKRGCPNKSQLFHVHVALGDGAGRARIKRKKRLAVFVSGGGSNFRSIHEAAVNSLVHGDVVALVTDKPSEEFVSLDLRRASN